VIAIAREPVSPSAEPALDGLMLALPSQPGAMRLRDALALGEGFELHLVACATPRVARALLAWLSVEAGRSDRGAKFERIAVQLGPDGAVVDGPELAGALLGVLTTPPGASVVRFLDASAVRTVDLPAWEWFVQRLNERRNQVAAAAPAPLVLLLGPALARSLPFLAPDLWSVRSVDVALGEAPAMPGVEGVEVALAPWVLAGDEPSAVRAELEDLGDPEGPHAARARLSLLGRLARALRQRGELAAAERVINDEWIPSAEALGDEGEVAEARVELASILVTRGEWDAAQRLLGQARATFERLGDVRSRAVTLGKVADILADRGDLDEALRIRREEELPVYERLGDVRSRAITLGQVADILAARGDLDEALRIRREENCRCRAAGGRPVARGHAGEGRRHPGARRPRRSPAHARGVPASGWGTSGRVRSRWGRSPTSWQPVATSTKPCASCARICSRSTSGWGTSGRARSRWGRSPTSWRPEATSTKPCASGARKNSRSSSGWGTSGRARSRWGRSPTSWRPGAPSTKPCASGARKELPVYERLGDVRARAVTLGKVADILAARGDLDEALRIRREEELPVFERLGDVRARAVTLGKVADILAARGDLDEAVRIRREEELPVYERLGDVRERAVALGKVADTLADRGDLDEALRIRREEELPVYERLGDVRARALTLGKVADILAARGDLDEALRTLREDLLPVFERLGDIRARAVTLGKVADILAARGDLDEALRIRREEELPVYERLGGRDLMVGLANLGILLVQRGRPADLVEARSCLERARALADAMKLPFPDELRAWLASGARSA
jgi:tetratricopeptide (TPR) repeat protein